MVQRACRNNNIHTIYVFYVNALSFILYKNSQAIHFSNSVPSFPFLFEMLRRRHPSKPPSSRACNRVHRPKQPVIPPISPIGPRVPTRTTITGLILFLITLFTRTHRIQYPARVVFDEFHFATFIDEYHQGKYLFDIHPPFAKLVLFAATKVTGYVAAQSRIASIGEQYGNMTYIPQRMLSAIFGSFIPVTSFLIATCLNLSWDVCVCVAAMSIFDVLLCIESRLIITDCQLILYANLCLLFALQLWKTVPNTTCRIIYLLLTSLFGAFAICTKWTGVITPLLIAFISFSKVPIQPYSGLSLFEMAIAGSFACLIYMAMFWIHFKLLPYSGSGDAFMPHSFRRALKNGRFYNPNAAGMPFFDAFKHLNWEMFRANRAIKTRHPWESKWYEWLYNARGVSYYNTLTMDGKREMIYAIINPLLIPISIIALIICTITICITPRVLRRAQTMGRERQVKQQRVKMGTFLCAWICNIVPYVCIERCTFVYHALPALQMACMMAGFALQMISDRFLCRQIVCIGLIVALGVTFKWWSAWIYAYPISKQEVKSLMLMPRWN